MNGGPLFLPIVSAHMTKAHPPPTLTPSHPTPPPSHPHKPTVSLPEFISTLDLPNHAQLLHNLSETYKLARYRDGVSALISGVVHRGGGGGGVDSLCI